jgi:hypothetical protein
MLITFDGFFQITYTLDGSIVPLIIWQLVEPRQSALVVGIAIARNNRIFILFLIDVPKVSALNALFTCCLRLTESLCFEGIMVFSFSYAV